jgi:hypothetical protein
MNRSLPLVLLAFTVLGLGLWLGLGGARPTLLGGPGSLDPSQLAGSTYEDGPQGSSDLFRMLGRTRDRVERWSRPLGEVPPGGTLVVISPATTMLLEEQRQLLLHAEAGGTVLLVVDELPELLQDRGLEMRQVPLPASSRPQIPSPLVDPAAPLESRGMGLLHPGTGVLSLYGSSHGARVASVALGQGRLLVVTDPFVLSNQGIRRDGNLRFAWRLSHNLPEPIRFDERHHGFEPRRGLLAYTRARQLWPSLILLTLLALLALWRASLRPLPSPPSIPPMPRGASALVAPLAERLAESRDHSRLVQLLRAEARRRGLAPVPSRARDDEVLLEAAKALSAPPPPFPRGPHA